MLRLYLNGLAGTILLLLGVQNVRVSRPPLIGLSLSLRLALLGRSDG